MSYSYKFQGKKTHEMHLADLKAKGICIKVLGSYAGAATKIEYECPICHRGFYRTPDDVLHGRLNCYSCSRVQSGLSKRSTSYSGYALELKRRSKGLVTLVGEFKGMTIPTLHTCRLHGDFVKSPTQVIYNTSTFSCLGCAKMKSGFSRNSLDDCKKYLSDRYILLNATYTRLGTIENLIVRCKTHGTYTKPKREILYNKYSGCDGCMYENSGSVKTKTVKIGRKIYKLQGYEPYALRDLLIKYKPSQIHTALGGKLFRIPYKWGSKSHTYLPDFIVGNTIYEVKSVYTLMPDYKSLSRNRAKARASIKSGYTFILWVYDKNGKRLKTKRDWMLCSYRELKKYYGLK